MDKEKRFSGIENIVELIVNSTLTPKKFVVNSQQLQVVNARSSTYLLWKFLVRERQFVTAVIFPSLT